ncbi:MAG: ribosome maturation factor RimM [Cellulosilyticaceae bacterium]
MEAMFTIGKIVNTHGVKGEMRILPSTDDIKRFEKLKEVTVINREEKVYEIVGIRYHKNFVLLRFKGIDTLDAAELLKNATIKISRKDSLPLNEDEYYISDLYDMKVMTEEGRELGEIKDILYTGSSNDVYVVFNKETNKEILIPAIKQCIKKVDVSANQMTVHLLEGLE